MITPHTHVNDLEVLFVLDPCARACPHWACQGLDQGIPNDPGFCGMRVVTGKTVQAPRLRILASSWGFEVRTTLPHSPDRPCMPSQKDMILGLALKTRWIGRRRALGKKSFVLLHIGKLIDDDFPRFIVRFCRRILPALLRLKAAAVGPVDEQMVNNPPGMTSREGVFLGKDMSHHQFVPEGVWRPVGELGFFIPCGPVVCDLKG